MRLNRLDLTRYGKFTDKTIDFGLAPPKGKIDFHILYGPNEAGKSTTFAALLDLLFGIGTKSKYAFLHPYSSMQIGASVEWSGLARELFRVKRNQNTLLDGDQQPVPEGVLQSALGGIDRTGYLSMFSLDDDSLEEGGESILASNGDLGQLLFAASSGLANLSQGLADLRAESEGFYKKGGKLTDLGRLKTKLAELKDEREKLDTMAAAYGHIRETRDRTQEQYDQALAERGRVQSRLDYFQTCLQMIPRLASWRRLREQLLPLIDLPSPPTGWAEALTKLQTEETTLVTEAQLGLKRLQEAQSDRDLLVVDERAADLHAGFEGLGLSKSRYLTAIDDVPKRQAEINECNTKIRAILAALGRRGEEEPRNLILTANKIATLRALIEQRASIETLIATAADELEDAKDRLAETTDRLNEAGGSQEDESERLEAMASLTEIVSALRKDDHLARKKLAAGNHARQQQTIAGQLDKLLPWEGTIEELSALPVPNNATIAKWKKDLISFQAEVDRTRAECDRLKKESQRLTSERDAIATISGVVSDQDAAQVRGAREDAWSLHRKRLDQQSAEHFEAALRKDDGVVAARFAHNHDLVKLQQLNQSLHLQATSLQHAEQEFETTHAALESLQQTISAAITALSPMLQDRDIAEVETWIGLRDVALTSKAPAREAKRALSEAEADGAAAILRLKAALNAVDVEHDLNADYLLLLAQAGAIADAYTDRAQLRAKLSERKTELRARERKKQKAEEALTGWIEDWSKACADCWIGDQGTSPPLELVRDILTEIVKLEPELEELKRLQYRVDAMNQDKKDFEAEVDRLVIDLGIERAADSPLVLYQKAAERAKSASEVRTKRIAKEDEIETLLTTERQLQDKQRAHEDRKNVMLRFFDVETLAEVAEKLQKVVKRGELSKQIEDIETEIQSAMKLEEMAQAEAILDGPDQVGLSQEVSELKGRFDDLDKLCRDLFAENAGAIAQLSAVGGDDAIVRIESQRRTIQLQIEDGARAYLRSRLGVAAAEQALRHYRNLHQSSMLARASEAFRTISRGAYPTLTTKSEKDGEILIATAADGRSKVASELSKGTRFQLYLALRVAGYFEFAKSRDTVPFIGDDIMETFDDFRAEEALGLFADMSKVGQVIYMTHHQHLCTIAEKTCPGVRIHNFE
jgi:uncharacterized protein YhaN